MLVVQVELEVKYLYHNMMSTLVVFYDYALLQIDIHIDISKATALSSPGGGRKFVHFFEYGG